MGRVDKDWIFSFFGFETHQGLEWGKAVTLRPGLWLRENGRRCIQVRRIKLIEKKSSLLLPTACGCLVEGKLPFCYLRTNHRIKNIIRLPRERSRSVTSSWGRACLKMFKRIQLRDASCKVSGTTRSALLSFS
jgi:hypothetical protein